MSKIPEDVKKMIGFISEKLYGISEYNSGDEESIYRKYLQSGYNYNDVVRGSMKAMGALKMVAFEHFKNNCRSFSANKHTKAAEVLYEAKKLSDLISNIEIEKPR